MRATTFIAALVLAACGWTSLPHARTELRLGDTLVAALDGREIQLRLASVETRDAYSLYVFVGAEGPVCGASGGKPVPAVPLAGRWDARTDWRPGGLTLACIDGVIGKCVVWGYRPWEPAMRDYHQACIRMVRADYCGTGVGHTRDGTPIDIWDSRGIQRRANVPGMRFEAAWGPDGAHGIRRTRFPVGMVHVLQRCPERLQFGQAPQLLFNASFPLRGDR